MDELVVGASFGLGKRREYKNTGWSNSKSQHLPVVDEDDTQIIGQIALPPEQATSSMENVMWGKSVARGEKRRAHLLQAF